MADEARRRRGVASLEVVDPLPQLRIRLADPDLPPIIVDGLPAAVAMEVPWDKIIDKLGDIIFGDGGGGGGGGGCTTIKITNPDGSTVEIKQCPPPKTT